MQTWSKILHRACPVVSANVEVRAATDLQFVGIRFRFGSLVSRAFTRFGLNNSVWGTTIWQTALGDVDICRSAISGYYKYGQDSEGRFVLLSHTELIRFCRGQSGVIRHKQSLDDHTYAHLPSYYCYISNSYANIIKKISNRNQAKHMACKQETLSTMYWCVGDGKFVTTGFVDTLRVSTRVRCPSRPGLRIASLEILSTRYVSNWNSVKISVLAHFSANHTGSRQTPPPQFWI